MTKGQKAQIQELKKKHNKVDDAFLALFEKRHIIFVEDGADLKKDCQCFAEDGQADTPEAKDGVGAVDGSREAGAEGVREADGLAAT